MLKIKKATANKLLALYMVSLVIAQSLLPLNLVFAEEPASYPTTTEEAQTSTQTETKDDVQVVEEVKTEIEDQSTLESEQVEESIVITEETNVLSSTLEGMKETFGNISTGVEYVYSLENNVRITFNTLPAGDNYVSIEQVSVEVDGVTQMGYSFETNMENGTFTYDMTLPNPLGNAAEVKFSEDGTNFDNISTEVSNPDTLTFAGDHFTIFVVVNPPADSNNQDDCNAVELGSTAGSTCFDTIQAAINAAAVTPGAPHTIYVAAGVFTQDNITIANDSDLYGLKIIGKGSGNTASDTIIDGNIKVYSTGTSDTAEGRLLFQDIRIVNSAVSGMDFFGSFFGGPTTVEYVELNNVHIENVNNYGIQFQRAPLNNFRIINSEFINTGAGLYIALEKVNGLYIEGTEFGNNVARDGRGAIITNSAGFTHENVVITSSTFRDYDTITNAAWGWGLYFNSVNNLTLTNNTFTNNKRGVYLEQMAGNVIVDGNTFENHDGATDRAVDFRGSTTPTVTFVNNTFNSNTTDLQYNLTNDMDAKDNNKWSSGYPTDLSSLNGIEALINHDCDASPFLTGLCQTTPPDRVSDSGSVDYANLLTSDVQVCKQDEFGNAVSGWNFGMMSEPIYTHTFTDAELQSAAGTTTPFSMSSGLYVMQATGTYNYRNVQGDGAYIADTKASLRSAGEFNVNADPTWVIGDDLPTVGTNEGWLELQVNDQNISWVNIGYYSPTHNYSKFMMLGNGPVKFSLKDDNYADNTNVDLSIVVRKVYDEITTDGTGCATFNDVEYGNMFIYEYSNEDFMLENVIDASGGLVDMYTDSAIVEVDEDTETFTFVNRFNFGRISGLKFNDLNGNGLNDSEPGLENWVIQLDADNDGDFDQTAVTGVNGIYEFNNLADGEYRVCEELVNGWQQTFPNSGTLNAELDINTNLYCNVVNVDSNNVEAYFGNQELEEPEVPVTPTNQIPSVVIIATPSVNVLAGTTVTLFGNILGGDAGFTYTWGGNCTGNGTNNGGITTGATVPNVAGTYFCSINVTDANGDNAAASVIVTVTPNGVGSPAPEVAGVNTSNSNTDTADDTESDVLGLAAQECEISFPVSGYVFVDSNDNNRKDSNEKGISNVEINLIAEDEIFARVTTNSDGRWERDLCPGSYRLRLTESSLPENVNLSASNVLSVSIDEETENVNFEVIEEVQETAGINWLLILLLILLILGLGGGYYYYTQNKKKDNLN
jgi:parallel beta-helix repeat protein